MGESEREWEREREEEEERKRAEAEGRRADHLFWAAQRAKSKRAQAADSAPD